MEVAAVEAALEPMRTALAADGFALMVAAVDPSTGTVEVVLEAGPEACEECLLPEPLLTRMLEEVLRRQVAGAGRVVLVRRAPA